jgi:hypothetical protein
MSSGGRINNVDATGFPIKRRDMTQEEMLAVSTAVRAFNRFTFEQRIMFYKLTSGESQQGQQ